MTARHDPEHLSDDALVERFKAQGGDRYFAEIARRHGRTIQAACRRFLRDESLAEDLMQETFKRAFTEIGGFHAGNFRGWLFTIARRLCINHLKSKYSREIAAIENPDLLACSRNQERDLLKSDEILAVLKDLPAEQRICLKLLYIEGLSYVEIATTTGYSEADVKSYVQNGKRRFKILWEKR
jgi:RNA polymerase sigma factor (sigma-70 family)